MLPSLSKLSIVSTSGDILGPRLLFSRTEPFLQLDYHHLVCETRKRCLEAMDTTDVESVQSMDAVVSFIATETQTSFIEVPKQMITAETSPFRTNGKLLLTIVELSTQEYMIGITSYESTVAKVYEFNKFVRSKWRQEDQKGF